MDVCVGMTCVLRPNILKDTLLSWDHNIVSFNKDFNFRFIFNVDPIGEKNTENNIKNIIQKYNKHSSVTFTQKPSFPLAVRNLIEKMDTEFCFLTEDDMVILRYIDVNKMVSVLKSNPNLASLKLDKNNTKGTWNKLNRRKISGTYQEEGYYLLKGHRKVFSMNTSLYRTSFLKEVLPFIEKGVSPERVLRLVKWKSEQKFNDLDNIMKKWQFGLFMKPNEDTQIQDIGTKWKKKMRFKKTKGGLHGTYKRGR